MRKHGHASPVLPIPASLGKNTQTLESGGRSLKGPKNHAQWRARACLPRALQNASEI